MACLQKTRLAACTRVDDGAPPRRKRCRVVRGAHAQITAKHRGAAVARLHLSFFLLYNTLFFWRHSVKLFLIMSKMKDVNER